MFQSPHLKVEADLTLGHSQDGGGGRLPSSSRGADTLGDSETHLPTLDSMDA